MKNYLGMSSIGFLCSISSRSPIISAFAPSVIRTTATAAFTKCTGTSTSASSSKVTTHLQSLKEEVDPGNIPGTDLQVLKYPHTALRQPNLEITQEELSSGNIKQIAKEMFLVMYGTQGVGLAAPQVGINKNLIVYNPTGDKTKWLDEVIMVNPKIVEFSEAVDVETEGCLSFPGMNADVERSKWIKVEAMKLNGKKMKKKYKGWEARIFQHEYDHLDGILYPDRLTEEAKEGVKERLDELVAEFGEGGAL
eukprot:scaffold10555_cov228-Chaetoceros_neogracile.AAC.3